MAQDSLVAGAGTLGGRGEEEGREEGREGPEVWASEQMREGRLPKSDDSLQIFILAVLQLKCKTVIPPPQKSKVSSGPKARQEISTLMPEMHSLKGKFGLWLHQNWFFFYSAKIKRIKIGAKDGYKNICKLCVSKSLIYKI